MVVAQPLAGDMPVLKIAAVRTAGFNPELVGGVLDVLFTGLGRRRM